jgi:hypothetical protein
VYNVVDTGSSISTAYGDSSSTFQGHLQTEFYGTDVSTISSFVSDYFTQYSILTDGPSISTGASSMFQMLSDLNSTTLGHISSGILGDPISTFSTIAYTQLLSVQTVFITAQDYSTFSSLYGIFSTTIVSTATLVSPSTNVAGYQTMSTLAQTTFSTFSTIFPIVLGYDILTTTSTLNSQLAVFSSILVPQNSTIYGLNSAYMAAAGVSSLNSNLSTYTQDYYLSASAQISTLSTVLQYSTLIYQSTLDTAAEFYSSITVITDYSTFAVIDFTSVETVSINDISSVSVSTVASQNGMIVQGPVYQLSSSVEAALSMSNIAIYATDSDVPYILGTKQIQAKVSSILFNSTFTIHTPSVGLTQASERLSTLVGINTTTPAYALDIGSGDARKPTGTQWINPSDERIKMAIGDADIDTVIKQISTLRLVSYTWSETYRQAHGLARGTMLGFLSQEVEAVFPGSVSSAPEEGFADFKSLNTDQIAKAKFALTCHLLSKVGKLQAKLNNLREV